MPPQAISPPTRPVGTPDKTGGTGYRGGRITDEWENIPDLTWPESVRTYGRMRRDAKISAVLKAMFLPIIRATWAVDPTGVANEESVHIVAQDLGLPVLGENLDDAESSIPGFAWPDHVRMALLSLVFGHMPMEQWYTLRNGRTRLAGLQERMPHTISELDIGDDGQMVQVYQNTQDNPITANRLLWYVNDREGANWAGTSLLRPCYTPWILKHETMRTHATSIRRFGMGVPSVSAPPGATPAQIEEAQRIASGMRAGDEAGAGLPDGYEFRLTGLTGAAPDALGFLGYLDQQITGSALANIVELAHSTYGSKALGESFLDLFLLALQAAADLIGDTATFGSPSMPGIARALTEYNFGEGQAIPRIVCTDVGDRHEITSDAMNLLMGAGAITPDPELEEFLRTAWGLPARPKDAPVPQPPAPPGANGQGQNGQGGQQLQGGNVTARTRLPRGAAPFPGTSWRRREMTQVEAAAGMDPDGILADLEDAATRLTAAWAPVLRDQRADLSAQVAQHVDSASLAALADLTVPDAGGADLLASAMTELAWTAARRAAAEASSQRVVIDMTRVTIDEGRLTAVAQARAVLAGQQLAHAATRRALRVVQATAGDDAAGEVEVHLAGLSPTPLGDQLRAALSTAQNSGRAAAFEQADDQGVTYTASEINDANTCDPCGAIDQTEFESIEEATAAYVNGGYVDCEGELRCRGTFIATYPDVTVTAPGDLPGTLPEEAPEPEDSLAAWSTDGVWDEDRAALHDQIVDQILAGAAPADEPVAYFMGGGPAAGKSSMPTPGGGLAALIDPDAIKALLPEYQQMVAAGDSRAAAYVHEESSHIAGLVRGQASARSLSFIVDGTGDSSYQKMAGKVQAARAGGATRVEADYVTIDTAEAIRRATKRAQRTGRMVPEAVITSIHAEVTKVFDQAVREGLFDEARLWDNSGASAVQIAHYTREGGLVVSDEQAWARFLAKAAG